MRTVQDQDIRGYHTTEDAQKEILLRKETKSR